MIEATAMREHMALAQKAANEAAAILMAGYRKRPTAEHKGRIDLVTEFDRRSEELLRDRLATTGFAFVGEEGGGESATSGATWYVDPLDGTTNFVHGHPFFAVSVGLVFDLVPVLGVVVAPALGLVWRGSSFHPSERGGERCHVSATRSLDEAMLATGFPYDRATSADNNLATFAAMKKRAQAIRRCGAAAIDLCLVADGTYDAYWERKLKPWDLAAGAAIVSAAGGRVTAYDGKVADVRSGHLVASNGLLHETLVNELRTIGLPPPT